MPAVNTRQPGEIWMTFPDLQIGYIDAANAASIQLHKSCGFNQIGYLASVGYKFGHWTDVVMMQRSLGSGGASPPEVWLPPPPETNASS